MSEPLENSITHLRDQSLQLNDITDRATAAVRRVETFLNQECRLGLAVYVPIPPAPGKGLPAPDAPRLQLGYARGGDRYRIVVRALAKDRDRTSENERSRDEQVAWSECPRALKIEAFQQLPALLTALHSHLAEIIQRADAALVAAQRITDVLGEAPPPEADDDGDEERGHHHHHGHHGPHGHHEHGPHGPHERGETRGDDRGRGEERGRAERGEERGHGRNKHKHGEGRGWDKA